MGSVEEQIRPPREVETGAARPGRHVRMPGAGSSTPGGGRLRRLFLGRGFGPYVLRRILVAIPVLALLSLCVFTLTSLVPGGPVYAYIGGHATNEATIKAVTARFHLDEGFFAQYWLWLRGVLHLTFGTSIFTDEKVAQEIRQRIGLTIALNVASAIASVAIGVPLGVVAAFRQGGRADRVAVGLSIFVSNAPAFALAVALLYLFSGVVHAFPQFGVGSGLFGYADHLVLPVAVLTLGGLGFLTKMTRAALLDTIHQDYVTFARCRGLSERRVMTHYIMRNALIPLLTVAGLIVIGFLSGTVFVEDVFGLPGLGQLFVSAVTTTDIPVIQALVLMTAAWIILVNIVIDVCYALVDPRVALEGRRK
jgi:peptide/nickel transport system permease protein